MALFFWVCWPYGTREYAKTFAAREIVNGELFLILDPLVSVSAAVAARMFVWSLAVAAGVILVGVLLPRAFCGYVCPLGTLIDVFDWLLGKAGRPSAFGQRGWWSGVRYYLLAVVLIAAGSGVLLSGFVAAIPVLTRAMLFVAAPFQMGLAKGWYLVPPANVGHVISIALLMLVFSVGYVAMARHHTSTGAFYSYVARSLGGYAGGAAAWIALVGYNTMQIGLYGLWGVISSAFLSVAFGWTVEWWLMAFIAIAVIAVLGYRQIDLFLRGVRQGERPRDGIFVTLLRHLLHHPEVLLWEKMWLDAHQDLSLIHI